MEWMGVAFWGVIVLAVVGGIAYASYAERKRREAVQRLASDMGLTFLPTLAPEDQNAFQQFNLASRGRAQKTSNAIVADSGELRMVLFDFQYTTGSGKNQSTRRQNVVLASSSSLSLPVFAISPESFFHRISSFFGHNDIDFNDDPDFSQHFLLHGPHEAEVREFFTFERRQAFLEHRTLHVEGAGRHFIFYHPGKRRKPEEIKSLLAEAYDIYRVVS
ncbi:MAG: hypothetical protein KDB22_09765 [Planctomycetales bacterium]|nr:hypothetical protein [Planctomycetales bacterium]